MDKRVRLVFVPGNPVTLDSLCPKSHLLMLQSRLVAEGIAVDLLDFGTIRLTHESRCSAAEDSGTLMPGWMEQVVQGWGGFPVLHRVKPGIEQHQGDSTKAALLDRLTEGQPQFVAFWIQDRDAYREVKELSRGIRGVLGETCQVAAGPYAVHYGACALTDCASLDAIITGNMTESLLALLNSDTSAGSWQSVPGLISRNADGGVRKHETRDFPCNVVPLAVGGLQPREELAQFPLFPMTFSLLPSDFYYQDARRLDCSIKEPEVLVEEMKFLHRCFGARVFHVSAAYVGPDELADFADLLLKQNLVVIYSLGDVTECVGSAVAERLFASGCRAMGYRIPTGSQRMLEDFYGCSASISAMRASLRHCKAAGIFTVIRICYPCPADDYHTRAEIELFIAASKPDAVCLETPKIVPDSFWFRRASEYGFFINHKDFHRYVVGGNSAYGSMPYTMRGWSAKRVRQEQAALTAVIIKSGCMVDVTEQQGILARLVRGTKAEAGFIEELQEALDSCDSIRLEKLVECMNANVRTLKTDVASTGERVGKAASFS